MGEHPLDVDYEALDRLLAALGESVAIRIHAKGHATAATMPQAAEAALPQPGMRAIFVQSDGEVLAAPSPRGSALMPGRFSQEMKVSRKSRG